MASVASLLALSSASSCVWPRRSSSSMRSTVAPVAFIAWASGCNSSSAGGTRTSKRSDAKDSAASLTRAIRCSRDANNANVRAAEARIAAIGTTTRDHAWGPTRASRTTAATAVVAYAAATRISTVRARGIVLSDELVTNSTHRQKMARDGWTGLQLLAKPAHVHIYGAAAADPVVTPDVRKQLLAREDLAGVLREEEEQVELFRLEHALRAVVQHASAARVELERARGDAGAVGMIPVRDTAKERADPCEQLAQAEGLREIIVRAHLEANHLIDFLAFCCEYEDRDVRLRPEPPADFEAVHLRQHQVEQHEVRARAACFFDRRQAVRGGDHPETILAQVER